MKKWETLDNEISLSKMVMEGKKELVDHLFFAFITNNHPPVLKKIRETIMRSNEDPVLLFKRDFLSKYPYYRNLYYQYLKGEGYHTKDDILDCISDLCIGNIENKKESWKQLEAIEDILIDENTNMITVISSSKERYSFFPAISLYYEEIKSIREKHIKDYPKVDMSQLFPNGYNPYAPENLEYCCHYVSTEFVRLHPECYIVASICPHCFSGCYWYHSFVINKDENYVIDIANGFAMPLGDFISLLEPTILCQVKGSEFSFELENVLPEFKMVFLEMRLCLLLFLK